MRATQDICRVEGHSLIGFDSETPYIRAMKKQHPKLAAFDYSLKADSNLAQLAAIRAGFGIGMCQAAIARRDPGLVRLLPQDVDLALPMWVAMHENLKSTLRCAVTFKALVEGLQAYVGRGK